MADDQPDATRITRRHLLGALGSTGVAVSANSFLLPAAHAGALPRSRPNVIVILADDVGAEELGYYGNTFNETPNLDALAPRCTGHD